MSIVLLRWIRGRVVHYYDCNLGYTLCGRKVTIPGQVESAFYSNLDTCRACKKRVTG